MNSSSDPSSHQRLPIRQSSDVPLPDGVGNVSRALSSTQVRQRIYMITLHTFDTNEAAFQTINEGAYESLETANTKAREIANRKLRPA